MDILNEDQDQQQEKRVSIMIWVTPEERQQIRIKAAEAGLYIRDYILYRTIYSQQEE
jgi:hypothetical protein